MAYSGKLTVNDEFELFTQFIRFITADSTVAGQDWQVLYRQVISYTNNIAQTTFKGTLTAVSLDTPILLDTVCVYDYNFGNQITGEVVGTGDGNTTSFSYTTANTPIAPFSIVITATTSGTTYTATDDGAGNISGTIVSGTVDYSTGTISLTFTTAPDSGTNITIDYLNNIYVEGTDYTIDTLRGEVVFLSTGSVVSGSDVSYIYNWKPERIAVKNVGFSGTENVEFAIEPHFHISGAEGCIIFRYYTDIDTVNDNFIGLGGDRAVAFWNNISDMWIFSNAQRIILVAKSGSYYSIGYFGFVHRVCLTNEYPEPLVFVSSHYNDGSYTTYVSYDDETDNTHAFMFTNNYYYRDWNFADTSIVFDSNYGHHSPHISNWGIDLTPVSYPDTTKIVFFPLLLAPDNDIAVGYYDNVFMVLGNELTPESIITDSNNATYIAFPDVFRTSLNFVYVIKEE